MLELFFLWDVPEIRFSCSEDGQTAELKARKREGERIARAGILSVRTFDSEVRLARGCTVLRRTC